MICPYCGAENDDNAKVCCLCECEFKTEAAENDTIQPEVTEDTPVKKKNSSVTVIIVILTAVAIILAGILLYLYLFDNDHKNHNSGTLSSETEITSEANSFTETVSEIAAETLIVSSTSAAETTTEATTVETSAVVTDASLENENVNERKQYYMHELKAMTGKEIAQLCGDKYSCVISNYSGTAFEFTSPSVLPGYRIYFEYNGNDKYIPDDKLPVMIRMDYGEAEEKISFGMTYSEFIKISGVPDCINWDNMNGGGFYVSQTFGEINVNYKFQTDFDVFDYLSELTGEYYEFKVDDQINSYLLEQNPCISEIWCK